MKVTVLPSDMDAPGCYRVLFPMRQMQQQGEHRVVMPERTEEEREDGRTLINFDLRLDPPYPFADIWVLQQRKERMWAEFGVKALRRAGIISVADLDDNYLELPFYNPAWKGSHPYRRDDGTILDRKMRRRLPGFNGKVPPNKHNRMWMNDMIQQVDHLTVSTPYLAELYSRFNKNITVLRNYLDWDIWQDIEPQYKVERPRLRIGYLGVFSYRQGDLELIRDVIPEFLRKHPNVDFVANSAAVHEFLRVPYEQRIVEPEYAFRPKEGDYPVGRKTAVLDIGLVPLALNGLNRAKSHLKGMEYNAAGIPFIATPTESYRDYWCVPGQNGFIAETPKEWLACLEELVSDDSLRREMGAIGREIASAHTYQFHWTEWEELYRKLIGGTEERITRAAISKGAIQKVNEFSGLLRFLRGKKLDTIVEIGSAHGGTFWAFANIAAGDALLVSIDIPAGSNPDTNPFTGSDIYGTRNRDRIARYGNRDQKVELIDGDSHTQHTLDRLTRVLDGRKIDVLFIDGDHTYKGVAQDYSMYEPLVAEGGVIAFHDIAHHHDKRIGVEKLWNQLRVHEQTVEFLAPNETWGYRPWAGIGAVTKSV